MLKQAMAQVFKCQPAILKQLKNIAVEFAFNMDEEDVGIFATHRRRRA